MARWLVEHYPEVALAAGILVASAAGQLLRRGGNDVDADRTGANSQSWRTADRV